MKSKITVYGLAAMFLLGGSLFGQTADSADPQQASNQDQMQDGMQNQMGPLADELSQLRLTYREQVRVMLEGRQRLIERYRLATEEGKAAIRKQLREHQETIAESHRLLRRQMRDQIREIRDERRKRILNQGG